MATAWNDAAKAMAQPHRQPAERARRKHEWREFEIGEWVFVVRPFVPEKVDKSIKGRRRGLKKGVISTRKFAARWAGPYRIATKLSLVI